MKVTATKDSPPALQLIASRGIDLQKSKITLRLSMRLATAIVEHQIGHKTIVA